MEKTYKTTGIVLISRDFGESDRLFVVYTRDYGKIEVLAKGAKKILSKLNAHMAEYSLVDMMVANGSKLDKLAGAVLIKDYTNIKASLVGVALASYLAEVFNILFAAPQKDQQIFDKLVLLFDYLDENINLLKKLELEKRMYQFIGEIMKDLGYLKKEDEIQEGNILNYLGRELKTAQFLANIS